MKAKCILLLVVTLLFSCKQKEQKQEQQGQEQETKLIAYECDFAEDIKLGENMTCGYLEVPENYDRPEGRKIKIAYVILKAGSANEEAGYPMIYFSGGPGGKSIAEQAITGWSGAPVIKDRDIILFDQRGINYSSALPDIGPALFEAMAADADMEEETKRFADVLELYKKQCMEQGIDLGNYNSFENAKDVGRLMKHLNYDKYNLYGGSYGTRLARVVQDMFPEKINSVILDAPAPMQTDFLISRLDSYSLALQRIFDFCDNDPECSSTYPDLKARYLAAIKSLKNNPVPITMDEEGEIFYVNAQDAIYFLRRRLYWNTSRESVPEFIMALSERKKDIIKTAVNNEKNGMVAFMNTSMMLAVENHEQFDAKYTPEVIDSIYRTLPLFPDKLGFFTALYEVGHSWHDNRLPNDKRIFKRSDVPTLIFVNHYDPVTPPEYGALFKEKLPNSTLFILDKGGHGSVNDACSLQVMMDFMNNPDIASLDASCLKLYSD